MGLLINAQPTMEPSVFPANFAKVIGMDENLCRTDSWMPG
jgi:trimethylamine:corrinoid methyltransferase-like protein